MFTISKKKKDKITVSFIDEAAAEDVTGSGVLITTPNHKILLDYGLVQSNDKYTDFIANNRKTKEFKAKDIDFVFVSHNHGDHCLAIPKLYKNGFRGATIISEGSKGIFRIMTEDSAQITERDVLVINNQYDKKYEPLYSLADVHTMLEYTLEKPINEKIHINDEISFKFVPSGHLLGGCQIILYITIDGLNANTNYRLNFVYTTAKVDPETEEIEIKKRKTINEKMIIIPVVLIGIIGGVFKPVEKCDLVIGESTYGNRPEIKTGRKERKNDLDKLKAIIDTQVKEMNGRVLIPSFAQSRIQQLALYIYQLFKNEEWQPKVYIDSPLAIQIFKEYMNVLDGEDKEVFDELMNWDNLIFTKESEDSKWLVASGEPCVILSTAGFCQVGRVRHHLKALVGNPNATVLFVGYSSPGSLASLLKDPKCKTITIDQKEYKCRCACYSLKSLSGHMPFNQLIDYYSSINCNKIVLHHGSTDAKEGLKKVLEKELTKKCKTTRVVCANSSLKFNL